MCYTVNYLLRRQIEIGKAGDESPKVLDAMLEEYHKLAKVCGPTYFETGFNPSAKLPVLTDLATKKVEMANWGLIPFFIKIPHEARKFRIKTLNARSEGMAIKPTWKTSIKNKRCIIIVDGFYEYHHYQGVTYPFFIHLREGKKMYMAGLWNDWTDKTTGEIFRTVAIITTEANDIMKHIHNNPKNPHRMPVILPREMLEEWMTKFDHDGPLEKNEKELILDLTRTYDGDDMIYYTTPRLIGKTGVGNTPDAVKRLDYIELTDLEWPEYAQQLELVVCQD